MRKSTLLKVMNNDFGVAIFKVLDSISTFEKIQKIIKNYLIGILILMIDAIIKVR